MKITIVTGGSHGDLHPFLAIARRLIARGHDVELLAHPHFRADVLAAQVPHVAIAESLDAERILHNPDLMHRRKGGLLVLEMVIESVPESVATLRRHLLRRQPDVLLAHHICFGAPWVARELVLPCAIASLAPIAWFSRHDPVPLSARRPGVVHARLARIADHGLRGIAGWYGDRLLNRVRTRIGLPRERGVFLHQFRGGDVNLALWSPQFRPPLADDPPHSRICGFAWYDRSDRMPQLSAALERFLESGSPPIVFSLGTAAIYSAGDFYQVATQACQMLGRRGVLLTGRVENEPRELPPSMLACQYAPFSLLLPRGGASVHHGGIGSTAQALRAGRPMVVVPHAHDQFHNALHAVRLGVGAVVARHRLTAVRLAGALQSVLDDARVRDRAAQVGAAIAREDGALVAAEAIEGLHAGR